MIGVKIRNIIELYLIGPSRWPTWLRRIFVLTIPISFPLFVLFYFILFMSLILIDLWDIEE